MFKIMPKPTDLPGMTGPGVAPVKIAEVDDLVEKYVKARDARMAKTEIEVSAKQSLIAALHANEDKIGNVGGTLTYRHDDLIVTLRSGKEELKVKTMGGEEHED